MPVVDFSSRRGNNLIFKEETDLSAVVVNKSYSILEDFFPESLMIYLNGQKLTEGIANDYTMLSPSTFELKFTKYSHSVLTIGFLEK